MNNQWQPDRWSRPEIDGMRPNISTYDPGAFSWWIHARNGEVVASGSAKAPEQAQTDCDSAISELGGNESTRLRKATVETRKTLAVHMEACDDCLTGDRCNDGLGLRHEHLKAVATMKAVARRVVPRKPEVVEAAQ